MEQVLAALNAPLRIRNVCVVAHVDHGKTSICDHLVASNGYIAAKLAGKTRYLDSREDEQQRLITIKSSSIPLLYRPDDNDDDSSSEAYVVNLIDSPGHVDFSVEVSAATRLCDSALIVVDVIEGLRSQTKTVLRQAVLEGLQLLLVLNKMDRLFAELKMTPGNAYTHLRDVIENVNAYLNKCVQDSYLYSDTLESESHLVYENMAFEPGKGNVLFCSANDGWCFDLEDCARRVLQTVTGSVDEHKIPKIMTHCWGDWTLIPKKGQIVKRLGQPESTIAATQFLKPLEQIYRLGSAEPLDSGKLPELIKTISDHFEIPVQDRDIKDWLKHKSNIPAALLHKWSPLGTFMLKSIVKKLPSPVESYKERMLRIKQSAANDDPKDLEVSEKTLIEKPCALFIAKSIHVNFEQNRLTCDCLHGRETANDFVGFSRIFEGSLKIGDVLYATQESDNTLLNSADDDTAGSDNNSSEASMTVRKLYAPIGMDLVETDQAGPGAIVCVAFAEDSSQESDKSVKDTMTWLLSLASVQSADTNRRAGGFSIVDRCVTLSSKPGFAPLLNIYTKHRIGAMRIGISPVNLRDWQDFVRGLALLYRADPAVSIDVIPETGEFVICCQGQVHHEKIIQDFRKLYCPGIELRMTPPLISLRESFQLDPSTAATPLSEQSFSLPFPPWAPNPTASEAKAAYTKWQWSKAGQGAAACGTVSYVKAKAVTMSENLLRFLDAEATGVADIVHARLLSRTAVDLIQRILHGLKASPFENSEIETKLNDRGLNKPDILESLTIAKCHLILFSCAEALANTTAECVAISVAGGGRTAAFLAPNEDSEPIPIIQDNNEDKAAWLQDRMFLDNLATESNLRSKPMSTPKGIYSIDSDSINRHKTSDAVPVSVSASTCDPKFTQSAAEKLDSMLKPQLRGSAALCVRHALDDITRRGPICEEPVRGVCWIISSMYTASQDEANDGSRENTSFARDLKDSLQGDLRPAGSLNGDDGATTVQVASIGPLIGTTRAAFRQGLQTRGCVRIWELMVKLEVSCSDSSLGRVHDLLGSRRGVVLSQAMLETTLEFVLLVEMPAGETFNLAVEMRRHASFIPITSYWKLNVEDPFEECALAQDVELMPSKGKMNTALKLVNSVRERKGLPTGQKVMEASADKQRTLKH